MNVIRYAQIRKMDISNGPGVGVSLFVQGCRFCCYGCFNQDTWDVNGGKEWTDDIETKFLSLVSKKHISRVSILGGEPLLDENIAGVLALVKKIKTFFPSKEIWLYTGYTWEELENFEKQADDVLRTRREIVIRCDVMIDGRYIDKERDKSLLWRGSRNQRVIDVRKSLAGRKVVLRVE